ncbi:NAD-glutamate dehydrogenase [Halioxenophilus sp. WMMB6]|uniref:NAD-glutamate dehydrogenase n=1 Tax=Halioxenophilus sp. WMMB6 TaxID=3073815 RepID=UPI00295F284D|nr:NAD-glutamate dehydrogenase [Halioxenophilus sp. WMMB6]
MEINSVMTQSESQFLERLGVNIKEEQAVSQQQEFGHFTELYFHRFPLNEIQGRQYKDIYGFLAGWWQRLKCYQESDYRVVVYNPNLEEHGWLCSHTVIQVHIRDMPFLTDSIRLELNRRNIRVHFLYSRVLQVVRAANGALVSVLDRNAAVTELPIGHYVQNEALIYFEINLHSSSSEMMQLRNAMEDVLVDICAVVADYQPMCSEAESACQNLSLAKNNPAANAELVAESQAFLQWLGQGHFTFLGYSEFELTAPGKSKKRVLRELTDRRRGIFRRSEAEKAPLAEADFNQGMAVFYRADDCIAFTKSNSRSRVHRSAYSDYVVVKKYSETGEVIGECRFLGLYTSAVYENKVANIPLIRDKVKYVMEQTAIDPDCYDGKTLLRILATLPRDEMFQLSKEQVLTLSTAVAQINERPLVRLFMRADPYGKFVNCLVFVPRDIFSTKIRLQIQNLIAAEIDAEECEFNTYFSESILARAHLVFRLKPGGSPEFDVHAIEQKTIDLTRGWDENLFSGLLEALGEEVGTKQYRSYQNAFSDAYREAYDARAAVADIATVSALSIDNPVAMSFYQPLGSNPKAIRFKVFHAGSPLHLSTVVPILENLGLRVLGEYPYDIEPEGAPVIWLHDFNLVFDGSANVDVSNTKRVFQEAFKAIWQGQAENDAFNRLVLGARLSWREVAILRSYARYMKQTVFNFGQSYIADTLAVHVDITRNLIALFKAKFEPRINQFSKLDKERIERLQQKIVDALENVDNLNDDRIIRRYLDLLKGTLRTNYFKKGADGEPLAYLSFKLAPREIPEIPEPRPLYEIFVYSPRIEGVHLRGGAVARGGLRWSDRLQDYRTEVLGLVKAQQVKNAVIVPSGAKGGFVVKQPPKEGGRKGLQAEAIECYKIFIRGLLDITDNIIDGQPRAPKDVVRHDGADPYLVVAADKGTATFSDIANRISLEYGHWLGDAFASGGSQGYDHKGMGITARGAWVSVQRHFREQGIDIQQQDFSVVGIGDMSGDVFGNGMLLSEHICLVAAFNHLSIFIDPNPDAAASFTERQRLFQNPQLNWEDYNRELISGGGGVFSRDLKSIVITPEMKERFQIEEPRLAPNDLINRLLKSPVDLIWNGGIGTYVKSSREINGDVGDKTNDTLRVDGNELRCRVFGEGGNLGMTQLGRVEYCLNGGACNTDFIDNAAGVDCSDHEVNIKILIDKLVAQGDMTDKQRNKLLVDMTESVAELVLANNYQQTQAISLAHHSGLERFAEYRRLIAQLESQGRLKRKLEFLPDEEGLLERHSHQKGLTRPELSVLISYVKVMLKELFAADDIVADPYICRMVESAFPALLKKNFLKEIQQHILRKEIIATQLANDMVNNGGITFYHRLFETTGAPATNIARAYVTARDVFSMPDFRSEIEQLDLKQGAELQMQELNKLVRRVRRGTRWFLRNRRSQLNPVAEVPHFNRSLAELAKIMPEVLQGEERATWQCRYQESIELGFSALYAGANALPSHLYSGLGAVEAARESKGDLRQVAQIFFFLSDRLGLNWFARQISDVSVENYWQAMARESFLDDMESQIRSLTVSFVRLKPETMDLDETYSRWMQQHKEMYDRWSTMMLELQSSSVSDFAMFSVAMRELFDLAQATSFCDNLCDVSTECTGGQASVGIESSRAS